MNPKIIRYMFAPDFPLYHQDRSLCGDCGCPGDVVKCSSEQNRTRKSQEVTVVEAGAGEKTIFYPKTGILMLSGNFMKDGYHNITFGRWDFWSSIYYPDQLFLRRNQVRINNWKEIVNILDELNRDPMDELIERVSSELEEEEEEQD